MLGRSGSDGADAPEREASAVDVGAVEDIVIVEGIVVADEAAVSTLVLCASVVGGNGAPAVPARSHGLGGEAVVMVDHLCLHHVDWTLLQESCRKRYQVCQEVEV